MVVALKVVVHRFGWSVHATNCTDTWVLLSLLMLLMLMLMVMLEMLRLLVRTLLLLLLLLHQEGSVQLLPRRLVDIIERLATKNWAHGLVRR